MKKWIALGVVAWWMLIIQACTNVKESQELKAIEPLPENPAQAAAFLVQNKAETWVQLSKPSENTASLEINSDRVTRSESGLSLVWLRLGLLESVALGGHSNQMMVQTLIQMQVRCRDNHYRYLHFYALDESQNIIDMHDSPQSEFFPLGSSAAAAGMYRIACELSPAL